MLLFYDILNTVLFFGFLFIGDYVAALLSFFENLKLSNLSS
jgi:hypothetical protein